MIDRFDSSVTSLDVSLSSVKRQPFTVIYRLEYFALNYTAERKFKGKRSIGYVLITERLYPLALNRCDILARRNGIKLPLTASCQTSEYVVRNGKLRPEVISYETIF